MTSVHRNPEAVAAVRQAELAAARARGIAAVNRTVGGVRSRYITDIPGQEMIYLQKDAEARGWLADPDPAPADYPFLSAEVGITAADAGQVAQVYLNLAAQLRAIAAALETGRLGAIAAIETAVDAAAVDAAVAALAAALEEFG